MPVVSCLVIALVFASLRTATESLPGRVIPPFAWMLVIFILSHQPTLPYPGDLDARIISTLGHVGVFAVLATLNWWALGRTQLSSTRRAVLAVLFAVIYGVLDEWHQSFVPGRTPDIRDIIADAFGAIMAVIVVTWLARRVGEGQESPA